MQKDSEARSFIKKIKDEINKRNWRSNKRNQDLIEKVLNDQNERKFPLNSNLEEAKHYTPNIINQQRAKPTGNLELPILPRQQVNVAKSSNLKDFTFKPAKKVFPSSIDLKYNKNNNQNINAEYRIEDNENKFAIGSLPLLEINNLSKIKKRENSSAGGKGSQAEQKNQNNTNSVSSNEQYKTIDEDFIDNSYQKNNRSPYYFNNPKYSKFLENKHVNLKIKKHVQNNDIKFLSDTNNISDGDLEIL